MNKEEKLIQLIENGFIEKSKIIDALKSGWKSTGLWYEEEKKALHSFFIDNNLTSTKQHFFSCGIIDEFEITRLDQPILDYGINHLSYALLSDSDDLIHKYANLTHSYYDKSIKNGTATPTYILQCIIKSDWVNFKGAMEIMKTKTLKKYPAMYLDIQVFEGIAERDKTKIENALAEFVTPKIHKQRNKHHILLNEFISHPALGYAKLAWLKGIQVEVDSPLVPLELLPVKPLSMYVNEYEFLNDVELLKK